MKMRILSPALAFLLTGIAVARADDKVPNAAIAAPQGGQTAKAYVDQIEANKKIGGQPFRLRLPGGTVPPPISELKPDALKPMPLLPGNTPRRVVGVPGLDRATTLPQGTAGLPRQTWPSGELQVAPYSTASDKVMVPAKDYARVERVSDLEAHNHAHVEDRIDGPVTPPPQRGRFQVALVGFEVNRWTRDDLLESDGRGDEVFLHCAVHHRTATGISAQFPRTAVMGDINTGPYRLRAGTQGDAGGLRSGDDVGTRRLPDHFPVDGFRAFRLPLLVFDGELVENQGAVLIAPSVWEWDDWGLAHGTGGLFRLGDFHVDPAAEQNRAARYEAGFGVGRRPETIRTRLTALLAERPMPGSQPNVSVIRGYPGAIGDVGGNRPIGMSEVEGEWIWQPQVLGLNYFTADYVSRTEFDGARGVVSVRYRDGESLCGDYTLHLQVRRIE